jgi:4'-phosphopantetheinyl transferase
MQFVIGRAAIRRVCSLAFEISPNAAEICLTRDGKPYLSGSDGRLEFSISHSNGIVVIAWTGSDAVGIDVEYADESLLFYEMAPLVFSKTECAALSAAHADDVGNMFFRIWVRKEAVLKAEGCGIDETTLRCFSSVLKRNSHFVWPLVLHFPPSLRSWRIEELVLGSNYLVAVAMPPPAELVLCPAEKILLPRQ